MMIKQKQVEVPMISLDGHNYYPEEIANVITALDQCDSRLKTVQISNSELKNQLKSENVIKFNSSGGAFPGPNFEQFKKDVSCFLSKKK